ncbi:MAG TPA: SMC-Scp complex subunit ScpB [Acidobacteriaceae bacterium]|nr:SMC-Scp complex subunit ScpB [Terriglobia bacterium]HVC89324.1 SMC-Scp complex subunit ScpB [Acidobacteriaceae bacterium]
MSLKAKIEAVIYAAEEPITLAQLASIFSDEVLAAMAASGLPFDATPPESDEASSTGIAESAALPEASPDLEAAVPNESVAGTATSPLGQPPLPMEDAAIRKQARLREREIRQAVEQIVEELIADYANGERGMEIREIAGGYRMATKAEYHDAVRSFVKSLKPQMKLSLQALETLAVIAYKQPVTAPEISEIRGVDTSGVLGSLMSRKLITTAGRKQVIGRPILYKTTKEFLLRFGLKDVSELPSMEEFEKMAADMAADMAESDPSDPEALPTGAGVNSASAESSAIDTITEETSVAEIARESSGLEP